MSKEKTISGELKAMLARWVPLSAIDDLERIAAEVESLETENAELREALEPLAIVDDMVTGLAAYAPDDYIIWSLTSDRPHGTFRLTLADARRANQLLKKGGKE